MTTLSTYPSSLTSRSRIHFIGMRGEEYHSAVKIWGLPDFYHLHHDKRIYGDVNENDILVHGPKSCPDFIQPFTDQDHERN